jgi:cyclopropane-fatty-acyl-phospholipid synthase
MNVREEAQKILDIAGIKINGKNNWDIKVNDESFYDKVLSGGSLALGETYIDGMWDAKHLDEFFYKILNSDIDKRIKFDLGFLLHLVKSKLLNRQSRRRAFQIGEEHYDKGNDLYKAMLDKKMVYTCGYWQTGANNLDESQEAKLNMVCKKIGLKKGDKILDIGCGWGSFLKYAAEKYGVKGVGITVSKEQAEFTRKNCKGLPIEIRLQDYRDVNEEFDHIISLGMFEHVGPKNYKDYFQVAGRCLKKDGLFLLHTIGGNISKNHGDPWIDKYIFPNGVLPSVSQIGKAIEGIFVMEDWHNFGADYDKTLMAWFENFDRHWSELKKTGKYDDRFYRIWKYYLLSCAGLFRARGAQLWQIVLSKGVKGGYKRIF